MRIVVVLIAGALLAGCVGDGLSLDERAGIVRADSGCDEAGAGAKSDPASPCFVARRSD